jgi:GT2 family glycosyltransferase
MASDLSLAEGPRTCEVLVSIINYKTAGLTIGCANSVLADLGPVDGLVVIVDNFSNDGSVQELQTWAAAHPQKARIRIIASPTNTGFSGGHNQAIAAAQSAFVLVLNSDAEVRPGFFAAIMAATARDEKAGLFAPGLEHDDGNLHTSCFRFHTPLSEFERGAANRHVTKMLGNHTVPLAIPPDPGEIQWASFACILLRSRMIRELGQMDEGYFLYFEDVEYCWRARQAGWRIAYVPEARAVHFRGGSGPVKDLQKAKKRLPPYYYASRTRLLYQQYGWMGLVASNLLWHLGRGVANARLLIGRAVPPSNEAQYRDIWTNVLSPLGDRRATKD